MKKIYYNEFQHTLLKYLSLITKQHILTLNLLHQNLKFTNSFQPISVLYNYFN